MRTARHITFCLCLFIPACADRDAGALEGQDGTGRLAKSDARSGASDFSILFVGNSHTMMHNVPAIVRKMILSRFPDRRVFTATLGVAFLDEAAKDGSFKQKLDSRPWNYVVLQAQKISQSGRFHYSRLEGIDMAKLARSHGASVLYYSEWGLRGVPATAFATKRSIAKWPRRPEPPWHPWVAPGTWPWLAGPTCRSTAPMAITSPKPAPSSPPVFSSAV